MRTTGYREQVLNRIREERTRQIQIWGSNEDTDLGFGGSVFGYSWLKPFVSPKVNNSHVEAVFRADYEVHEREGGEVTWMHLIREEVAELFDTCDPADTLEEAVQLAALCVSLCEKLLKEEETSGHTPHEVP